MIKIAVFCACVFVRLVMSCHAKYDPIEVQHRMRNEKRKAQEKCGYYHACQNLDARTYLQL